MTDVTSLLQGWERDLRRKGLNEFNNGKRVSYIASFSTWLEPVPLLQATPAQIEDWLDTKAMVARTRGWYISHLTTFFDWCQREGHVSTNPARRVTRPRVPRLLPRPWSEETFALALSKADPRMRCWLLLAGYAGLRCKEIAGLRREDVLDTSTPPMLLVHSGKGGHQRMLPVHPELLAALRAYGLPPQGLLWRSQRMRGKYRSAAESAYMLRPNTVSAYMARYLHGLGIDATAHQGRHRFATRCYKESHDLRLVQELMGHASPMTTSIYAAWDSGAAAGVIGNIGSRPAAVPAVPLTRPPLLASVLEMGATIDDIVVAVSEQESDLTDFADLCFITDRSPEEEGAWLRRIVDVWLEDPNRAAVLRDFRAPTQRDANRWSWAADCFEDGETAARLWLMLPDKLRAEVAGEVEQIRADLARPYPLLEVETVTEPTKCGNCGDEITGRVARVQDERFAYCGPCLQAAAEAVSAC